MKAANFIVKFMLKMKNKQVNIVFTFGLDNKLSEVTETTQVRSPMF